MNGIFRLAALKKPPKKPTKIVFFCQIMKEYRNKCGGRGGNGGSNLNFKLF